MKIVIFGLTITSSWGNGHATIWRGLCRALADLGNSIFFFEKDVPYYAAHRDLVEIPGVDVTLYDAWGTIQETAQAHVHSSDATIVTS